MNKFHIQTAIGSLIFAAVLAAFIFLAWVASGLFVQPVNAQEPNTATKQSQCQTVEKFVYALGRLPAELRNQVHVRVLSGDEMARWVSAFNKIPPPSAYGYDRAAFVFRDGNAFVAAIFEQDGCVIEAGKLPLDIYKRVMRDSGNALGQVI